MTETEAKWSEWVKEWKASGQTARAFAQGRDFKPSTLTYWAHRLRQIADGSAGSMISGGPAMRSTAAPRVRMVRVRPTALRGATARGTAAAVVSRPSIVVAVGAARIEVRSGFDHALLGEVVAALEGSRA